MRFYLIGIILSLIGNFARFILRGYWGLILSDRSTNNAVIRAIRIKLEAMKSSAEELRTNKKLIETLRDCADDERTRFNAAKLIHDTEIKIAELEFKTEEYENPATQKSEMTVSFPTAIQITYPTKENIHG